MEGAVYITVGVIFCCVVSGHDIEELLRRLDRQEERVLFLNQEIYRLNNKLAEQKSEHWSLKKRVSDVEQTLSAAGTPVTPRPTGYSDGDNVTLSQEHVMEKLRKDVNNLKSSLAEENRKCAQALTEVKSLKATSQSNSDRLDVVRVNVGNRITALSIKTEEMAAKCNSCLLQETGHHLNDSITEIKKTLAEVASKVTETCPVPTILHGKVEMPCSSIFNYTAVTVDRIPTGGSLYVSCDRDYRLKPRTRRLDKRQEMTCEDGAWTSLPECEANYCSRPSNLPVGSEVRDDRNPARYSHGTKLTLQCRQGYLPSGPDKVAQWTCLDTTWQHSGNLQCERRGCKVRAPGTNVRSVFRLPDGSTVTTTPGQKVPHGSKMLSRCNSFSNMTFTGASKRPCDDGLWIGDEPTCTEIVLGETQAVSRRFYTHYRGDRVRTTEEGHLSVKRGLSFTLSCVLTISTDVIWTSQNGLEKSEAEPRAPTTYRLDDRVVLYRNNLNIQDAHNDTFFCSPTDTSTPTAEFTVQVY